jgi:hypothetical protein
MRVVVVGANWGIFPEIHQPDTVTKDCFSLFLIHGRPFWPEVNGLRPAAALPSARKRVLDR